MYSTEGKVGNPRGAPNEVKSSTCHGQTVTDTGFTSHCFKSELPFLFH